MNHKAYPASGRCAIPKNSRRILEEISMKGKRTEEDRRHEGKTAGGR